MGLFERLFPASARALDMSFTEPAIRAPWAPQSLTRVAISELAGVKPGGVTRAQLMRIPAVVRGRGLICGTLARHPLALYEYGQPAQLEPAPWMNSTTTGQSPALRMLWTLDDLIFSGLSVWATKRDGDTLVDALRIPPGRWTVDPATNTVHVDGKPANAAEVIIFEGPQEGLITIAEESAAGSADLSNAWRQRVASPVPMVQVKQTAMNTTLSDREVDQLVDDVETARRKSGTVFVPDGYELDTSAGVGAAPDLYVQGRNADRIDWANHLQLPAAMLDGSMATASLTYSTAEGKRSEFLDYSLAYWGMPVEARLSQDDVTSAGRYSRFDLSALATPAQAGTNPATED